MIQSSKAEPCLLIIFGASGDLTQRKLIPSLYESFLQNALPKPFAVLGVSRTDLGDQGFRDKMRKTCSTHKGFTEQSWDEFSRLLYYQDGDATQHEGFEPVKQRIHQLCATLNTGENLLFYLSMAPQFYEPVIINLGTSGLVTEGKRWCSLNRAQAAWQRIIVEKPFGHDLESAAHLNRVLGRVFEEDAIYRIDHYLGKEAVQNLMVFRFANSIFEPLWSRQYVDYAQITAAETVGVEGRGGYYEHSGAMRDMIQSHLLQVMAVLAMEPPNSMAAADLRIEQRKVLQAVRDIPLDQVHHSAVRGQYGAGEFKGKPVVGYTQEPGVAKDSNTETYAAMRVNIDNWRWHGVPFYLRTGKRMTRKLTQIVLYFKPASHSMFTNEKGGSVLAPNRLNITIQPDEGITLRFEGKVPGSGMKVRSAAMDFDYVQQFGGEVPEAYGPLLLDAMEGDQSLFKDRHEIEAAWRIVMPVCERWASQPGSAMHTYAPGSWGPVESEKLYRTGHWHNPEGAVSRFASHEA